MSVRHSGALSIATPNHAMKTIITTLAVGAALAITAVAEFETWTNSEGREARMKLVEVVRDGDKIEGKFELQNGRTVSLDAGSLSEADAARLDAWKPPVEAKPSVFDDMLDGNLVILDGRRFSKHTLEQKPTKYYIFYYTASWCPPCQRYTPTLVNFYNEHRPKLDTFEIVLLTSDRDKDAMLGYARDKEMPWPHVDFSRAPKIKQELEHGVRGIPSVIVCDLEGNIVAQTTDINALIRLVTAGDAE